MDNQFTATRIADLLTGKNVSFGQKKMFGGECFMVEDKMLIGTYKGGLMARIDPAESDELVARSGASQMIHGGKPMVGYLFIEPEGYESDNDLTFWLEKCLTFNPKAKPSKKKG